MRKNIRELLGYPAIVIVCVCIALRGFIVSQLFFKKQGG